MIIHSTPRILAAGLRWYTLPGGYRQVKCDRCGNTVTLPHIPDGVECEEDRRGRAESLR